MVDEAPSHDVKRRRLTSDESSAQGIRCLNDLPSGILVHAASFLANPSKALFAIALDDTSAVTSNERSSAIIGDQLDNLDFGEIEKELAAKLSDGDIEKMLLCIDAVNQVKKLKLANCVNITGAGLEPLRGSTTIEQIDLSLVPCHQSPVLDPAPPILCDHVLPILDSIIDVEGCVLKYIQFPFTMRETPSAAPEFHAFIVRYNQMLDNREAIRCLECNVLLPDDSNQWFCNNEGDRELYGTQFHTCYGCLKDYCYSCRPSYNVMLGNCASCERDYCVDCAQISDCDSCGRTYCSNCYKHECHKCSEKICSDCVQEGRQCSPCMDCNKVSCLSCMENGDYNFLCDGCSQSCCSDCRLLRFRQGELDCAECILKIAPLLVDESNRLNEENQQLRNEVEELMREVKELKSRIEK